MKNFKPTFVFTHHLIKGFLHSLVMATVTFTWTIAVIHKGHPDAPSAFVLVSAVFLFHVAIGLIIALITKSYYARTNFAFAKDRATYSNDFVTTKVREVKYQNMKEVWFTQGILQRLFGLGTVHLLTHATPYSQQQKSGLKIYDVANPQETLADIKALVDAAQS